MKKSIPILIIICIILMYSSFAVSDYLNVSIDEVFFNDTFDTYNNTFLTYGWDTFAQNGGSGCVFNSPVRGSFGYNFSSCTGGSRTLGKNISFDIDTDDLCIIFNQNWSKLQTARILLKFNNGTLWRVIDYSAEFLEVQNSAYESLIIAFDGLTANNISQEIALEMDNTAGTFSAFIDGVIILNESQSWGVHSNFGDSMIVQIVQYWGSAEASSFMEDFLIFDGSLTGGTLSGQVPDSCSFPTLFCDRFNYTALVSTRNWTVYNSDSSYDETITPYQSYLYLNQTTKKTLYHSTGTFPLGGIDPLTGEAFGIEDPDSGVTYLSGFYASEFSTEFSFNLSNGSMQFYTESRKGKRAYHLLANVEGNISWYYYDSDDVLNLICANCTSKDIWHNFKSVAYFSTRPAMPFNSTYQKDRFILYIDGDELENHYYLYDNTTEYISDFFLIKGGGSVLSIDSYYDMVGTDKYTSTVDNSQVEIFLPVEELEDYYGENSLDSQIDSSLDALGLSSTKSKMFIGILTVIGVILVIFSGLMLKIGFAGAFAVSGFVGVLTMVLMVYLGFLPVWLLIVFAFFSVGLMIFAGKVILTGQ